MENFSLRELEACAFHCFQQEDYPQALKYFKALSVRSNVSVKNFAHLGRVYAKLKLFDEAREAFQIFIEQVPDAYIERFQLGLVLMELGNPQLSQEQWDIVLSLKPNFPPALFYKAQTCILNDDYVSAKFLTAELLNTTESTNLYHQFAKKLNEKISQKENGGSVTSITTENQYLGEFDAN